MVSLGKPFEVPDNILLMKKTFPLTSPRHEPPRVVAAIKNEVRKYLRRERKKPLPKDADYWAFECKVGLGSAEPETRRVGELIAAIDQAAVQNCEGVYIEILATPGHRAANADKDALAPDEAEDV